MTTYGYIILTNSNASLSKKFVVAQGGYRVLLQKAQTENLTIGGVDVAMGTIHEIHEYQIKVREGRYTFWSSGSSQDIPDDYGVLSDLETFYRYNNPNGTPSNVITMTDHYGNVHQVLFVGEFPKTPVTTILDTAQAVYFLPVRFRIIPP
jgi:hypothetical protein